MGLEEKVILTNYKVDSYGELNEALREGDEELALDLGMAEMDGVIAKTSLPESVVAYRGADASMFGSPDAYEENWTGKEITDNAFVSTTLSKSRMESMGASATDDWDDWDDGGYDDGPAGSTGPAVQIEMRLPQGAKALNMESFKDLRESELLLPRKSKFKVLSDSGPGEPRMMTMELIP